MALNYFQYELFWNTIKDYLEEFNVKFNYGFHLEPFLTGSQEIVGIFSDYGMFIFFDLDDTLIYPKIIESIHPNKVTIRLHPNIDFPYRKFEMILLKYSIRLMHEKGRIRNARK